MFCDVGRSELRGIQSFLISHSRYKVCPTQDAKEDSKASYFSFSFLVAFEKRPGEQFIVEYHPEQRGIANLPSVNTYPEPTLHVP